MLLLGHVKRRLQKVMVGESGVYGLIILISKKRNGLFREGFVRSWRLYQSMEMGFRSN